MGNGGQMGKWEAAVLEAIHQGDAKAMGMALKIALNFGALDVRGWTQVMSAAAQSSPECFAEGLARWIQACRPKVQWGVVGWRAAQAESSEALGMLWEASILESPGHLLAASAEGGWDQSVATLLGLGVDPNAQCLSSAALALQNGGGASVAALSGKDPRTASTALAKAAAREALGIMEALIKAGADVDGRSEGGWTALMSACAAGKAAAARLLIEGGADVEAKADDGTCAQDWTRAGSPCSALIDHERLRMVCGAQKAASRGPARV